MLTAKQLEHLKLPEGKNEHTLFDGDNLELRLRRTKSDLSRVWIFSYRWQGDRKKLYPGVYPEVSLAAARAIAKGHRDTLRANQDPAEVKRIAEAEAHAHMLATASGDVPKTLGELFERWDRDYLSTTHTDKGAYIRGIFERHVLPGGIAELHLSLMRAVHIKATLDRAKSAGLTTTCGRILDSLRQMIKWAAQFEWMDRDPTLGLKKSTWGGETQESDRTLSDDEVVQLDWRLRKSYLVNRWKHTVWLLLSTGTRIEETILAERRHVDLAKGTWTIPAENQKKTNAKSKRKPFIVHLSPFARQHMQALLAMPETEKYIFPARTRAPDKHPANEKTVAHALRNLQGVPQKGRRSNDELKLPGGDWSPHDLRRTAATFMRDLGAEEGVVDKCLNHVIQARITRIYQRSELRKAMVDSWDALGGHLAELSNRKDPEPSYQPPPPKYKIVDKTNPDAVRKRLPKAALRTAPPLPLATRRPLMAFEFKDDI